MLLYGDVPDSTGESVNKKACRSAVLLQKTAKKLNADTSNTRLALAA